MNREGTCPLFGFPSSFVIFRAPFLPHPPPLCCWVWDPSFFLHVRSEYLSPDRIVKRNNEKFKGYDLCSHFLRRRIFIYFTDEKWKQKLFANTLCSSRKNCVHTAQLLGCQVYVHNAKNGFLFKMQATYVHICHVHHTMKKENDL